MACILALALQIHFVYDQSMNVEQSDAALARVAGAIAEPARARMLCCLMDGHARTGTELAAVAEISASTASVHLARLKEQRLVKVLAQGKHRYYSLEDERVAAVLEALMVIGGERPAPFTPNTPTRLRSARTCYDHMAGTLGVTLHDSLFKMDWLYRASDDATSYRLTARGAREMSALGIDVDGLRSARRRFACACIDWSERRPHIGGAIGAALLSTATKRKWVAQDLDSRALRVTKSGQTAMLERFGVKLDAARAEG
jgi:DNA-binding transcriptional ArsR family regulator